MDYIQAFIVNMDLPRSLDEIAYDLFSSDAITQSIDEIFSTTDYKLVDENDEDSLAIGIVGTGTLGKYSAPRHATVGDICFFMCQKSAMQTYTRLRKATYDLCETNLTYKEFCDWLTDKTAFYPKKGKKQLYTLFYKDCDFWPHYESNDYMIVESLAKETRFLQTKSIFHHDRDYGYDKSHYLEVCEQVKNGNYRYFRFKHYRAGAIISHLIRMYETVMEYAGKIYAVGVVNTSPEQFNYEKYDHWRYGILTEFDKCFVLGSPIDLSEFKDEVSFCLRGSFTYVLGPAFEYIKNLVASRNEVPDYFMNCVSVPIPLSKINDLNWLEVTNKYRRGFILEAQFRAYYVDKLLSWVGDRKKFYMECKCYHHDAHYTCVDNVIVFLGKYLPVEVKLNVSIEKDILGQCKSYCGCPHIEVGN